MKAPGRDVGSARYRRGARLKTLPLGHWYTVKVRWMLVDFFPLSGTFHVTVPSSTVGPPATTWADVQYVAVQSLKGEVMGKGIFVLLAG